MNVDSHFAAWAAGFFDGEGCVNVSKTRSKSCRTGYSYSLEVKIAQMDITPLLEIQMRFGGTISKASSGFRENGVCHYLSFSNGQSLDFLSSIAPYSIAKKNQIEVALKFPFPRDFKYCGKRPIPIDELNKRQEIRDELVNIRKSLRVNA